MFGLASVVVLAVLQLVVADEAKKPVFQALYESADLQYTNDKFVKDVTYKFEQAGNSVASDIDFTVISDDLGDNKIMTNVDVYRLNENNEYELKVSKNLNNCEFLGMVRQMGYNPEFEKYGHLTVCNVKKDHYYVKHFVPDVSYIPASIPEGKYKVVGNVTHGDDLIIKGEYVGSLKRL